MLERRAFRNAFLGKIVLPKTIADCSIRQPACGMTLKQKQAAAQQFNLAKYLAGHHHPMAVDNISTLAVSLIACAAALAAYGSAIAAFCTALKGILKTPEALIGSVPFFMIGSLALCPVFIDAGRWIPALDQAGKLFLPYYYLHFFG